MDTFGYTTAGGNFAQISDYILGSHFTTTDAALATNIKAYLKNQTSNKVAKCAIYEYLGQGDAGALIAQTEEKVIPVSQDWYTFNFATYPVLASNTTYFLVAWANRPDDVGVPACSLAADLEQWIGLYNEIAYGAFPNPMTGETYSAGKHSIYATCTIYGPVFISNKNTMKVGV